MLLVAQLADFRQLSTAIEAGAIGSSSFIHLADDDRDDLSITLRWDGDQSTTWVVGGNVTTATATHGLRRPKGSP